MLDREFMAGRMTATTRRRIATLLFVQAH